jgi:hypothetical protein
LTASKIVGTDNFHAAVLHWMAALATVLVLAGVKLSEIVPGF